MSTPRPAWIDRLLAWFMAHQRPMPWRDDPSPYRVWISEMMLQQTQVATVIPYFERFMAQFPTVEDLARAPQEAVLKAWEGLGYYSRARNLHRAAQIIVEEHNGNLPATIAELRTLPGLGPYTAAAVASIAFAQPEPAVDGNVLRVFARFWGRDDNVSKMAVKKAFAADLRPHVSAADPSVFNQAVMEIGALICRPRQPLCDTCPLAPDCVARRDDRVAELPVKTKKPPRPHHDLATAVIWHEDRVLVEQRPADGMLAGLWDFPFRRRKPKESATATVRQLLADSYPRTQVEHTYSGVVKHGYTHFTIAVTAVRCRTEHPIPETATRRWLTLAELQTVPLPKSAHKLLALIADLELNGLR